MPQDMQQLFSRATAKWFHDAYGMPTKVQEEAWPAIKEGKPVLVSAPTGTGKTLSAFLVFIDRLHALAGEGKLRQELYLVYVSPLKSLAADIRENLQPPLEGIPKEEGAMEIQAAIRTGDTPQKDRQRMAKHPPHILITTPESLFLMLTSKSGQKVLKTAKAVIIDELHALIDTKRGAHLMLSIARLDKLCGSNLQRIGLSATIDPLELSAAYLSPEPAVICAPPMEKKVQIQVVGTLPAQGRRKDPVWEELGMAVYRQCCSCCGSVIAFSEGRRYVEKLAYYVNLLGGDGFARVHHGSLSKEQRAKAEQDLREGRLRLLCATSSMELGIDVGDVEQVLQVGCPRTVSSTMQRLGRAGHNPGRVSLMYMYPRTAQESIYCGMTAQIARQGGVEHAKPPLMCLDVLAQHLVSMATEEGYTLDQVMDILERAYSFQMVAREDVKDLLQMLAGDDEHRREIPVRPRVLYDRIHGQVRGDAYSRMLATAAGGTIPDKGLYVAKTEDGVKLGELDEEFVYESRIGDKFMLGSFGWRILRQDKDTVVVAQAPTEGARLPFWKGETKGRPLGASLAFGRMFHQLEEAGRDGRLEEELARLGLDQAAAAAGASFLQRQMAATGGLPDDRTILVEHFKDSTGSGQVMVHALLGRKVNGPLALLAKHAARAVSGLEIGCVDDEDGFLLYPYGPETLPKGLLYQIDPENARRVLEAALPLTPLFNMAFRYNAGRALMMGMKGAGRQPLWMQRLRSTEMLSSLIDEKNHPLIRETKRECLEYHWDLEGVVRILNGIRTGHIAVREIHLDIPSPMSLPFQWRVEAEEMYEYAPVTPRIQQAVYQDLKQADMVRPSAGELAQIQRQGKLPQNEDQLHSLLMMEGDLAAGEVQVPVEWLENLAEKERAFYVEPGLWIGAEQAKAYDQALCCQDEAAALPIVRRMLYYRGGKTAGEIGQRYVFPREMTERILRELVDSQRVVEDGGVYYHAKLYDKARQASIKSMRMETATCPPERYAALMAGKDQVRGTAEEQLAHGICQHCGKLYPVKFWESVLFCRRVDGYQEGMLDRLLAQGDYFWKMTQEGELCFCRYEDIDWEADSLLPLGSLEGDQRLMYQELSRRGASFLKFLADVPKKNSAQEVLLQLAQKGLVCADSFVPVRQWQNKEKIRKATARQRVNARVMALSAGRWDMARQVKAKTMEQWLEAFFQENLVLCRETFRRSALSAMHSPYALGLNGVSAGEWSWKQALEILRIWEYTGQIRRGYFVLGMSGAQFIRKEDFQWVTAALLEAGEQALWLHATDPAQLWGKVLDHLEGRSFLVAGGTAVCLVGGRPAAVLERQGKVLRVFEYGELEKALGELVKDFRHRRIFPELGRLAIKEYPKEAASMLRQAGFMGEMQDFVVYR